MSNTLEQELIDDREQWQKDFPEDPNMDPIEHLYLVREEINRRYPTLDAYFQHLEEWRQRKNTDRT
jgi:hypothetical protein